MRFEESRILMPKHMKGPKRNKLTRQIAKAVKAEQRGRAIRKAMKKRENPFEAHRIVEAPHGRW